MTDRGQGATSPQRRTASPRQPSRPQITRLGHPATQATRPRQQITQITLTQPSQQITQPSQQITRPPDQASR
jgi:hypothetical protein